MPRRQFLGSVIATTLSSNISAISSTIILTNGSTFPSGGSIPFVIVIDRGSASEEKVLVASRNLNDLYISQRGYDGTSAVPHNAGATVDHVLDATTLQGMNDVTYDNQISLLMEVI